MQTNLPRFPFDFSRLRNRIPAFIYIKLFGEGFVLEVRVLVKVLQLGKHKSNVSVMQDRERLQVEGEPYNSQSLFCIQT